MPLAQLVETCERVFETAPACGRGNTEERIRDAAHRGDDDGGPASVPRAGVPDNLNQSLNCFWIGDRGAAEFLDNHKQKILYADH
jgi:hypothetical protein